MLKTDGAEARSLEFSPGSSCEQKEFKYFVHHLLPPRMHRSRKLELGAELSREPRPLDLGGRCPAAILTPSLSASHKHIQDSSALARSPWEQALGAQGLHCSPTLAQACRSFPSWGPMNATCLLQVTSPTHCPKSSSCFSLGFTWLLLLMCSSERHRDSDREREKERE